MDKLHDYGIGSAIIQGVVHFSIALKENKIYRPLKETWLWADRNPSKCTLQIRSIDCYFQPLSDCGVPMASKISQNSTEGFHTQQMKFLVLSSNGTSACALASAVRK
eukprot:gene28532-37489_t